MSLDEYQQHVTSGQIVAHQPSVAGEHLLPGGEGYATWAPPSRRQPYGVLSQPRPGLLERAAVGLWDLCIDHKGVFVAPILNIIGDGVFSWLHFAPGSFAWGLGFAGAGLVSAGVGTLASLVHVGNPPSPHEVGTHQSGHVIGAVIGTAYGAMLVLGEMAAGLLGGPLWAGTWATGFAATVGLGVTSALHLSGRRTTHHVLQTHRVRADTERIFAVAELTNASRGALPANAAANAGAFDHHPLTNEILRALNVIGVVGASVAALTVNDAHRWHAVTNLPDGVAPSKVIAQVETLQGALKIRSRGLQLTPGMSGHQVVWSANNQPIAELAPPGPHPMLAAGGSMSFWTPIRMGLSLEDGAPVDVQIAGTSGILIAGTPGAGKSNAVAAITTAAVLADDAQLWYIDGSNREHVIFETVAARHGEDDIDDANDILGELQEEVSRRGSLLKSHRVTELTRKSAEELGLSVIVLGIGELATFTGHEDPKKSAAFNTRLRNIAAKGRACAVVTVADTQKPEAQVIPSAIRDLIVLKFALRCETTDQVTTILGRGMHKIAPAHEIDPDDKGVGYLKGVPGARRPIHLRTHQIEPEERYAIVDRVAATCTAPAPPTRPMPPDDDPGGIGDTFDRVAHVVGEHARTTPVRHLAIVRQDRYATHYPDGSAIPANVVDRWNLLFGFPEGFVWRDLVPVQVKNGTSRTSWQNVMDLWEGRGWVEQIGRRGNATLYIRTDLLEEGRADGKTA